MTDEEIFDLADDYGWQDDFGRWDFYPEGLINFALALTKRIAKGEKQEPVYVDSSRFPRGPLDHKPGTVIAKPVPAIDISQEPVDETAKGKHEPVAWMSPSCKLYPTRLRAVENGEQMVTPLYAAPPKREWVGLTKDEVNSWELPEKPTVFEFAQFVEAKLNEKNT